MNEFAIHITSNIGVLLFKTAFVFIVFMLIAISIRIISKIIIKTFFEEKEKFKNKEK